MATFLCYSSLVKLHKVLASPTLDYSSVCSLLITKKLLQLLKRTDITLFGAFSLLTLSSSSSQKSGVPTPSSCIELPNCNCVALFCVELR